MGRDDWYRRTSWSAADREALFSRLNRSRGAFNKAQYARIQASYLEKTGEPDLVHEALSLLDRVIIEWPDPSQLAAAHWQRATCLQRLGQSVPAIAAYREALEAERRNPRSLTNAYLDFAWLIATAPMPELFDEALSVLEERNELPTFPIDHNRFAAVRSLIAAARGEDTSARADAKRALEAASRTESGFRYHRQLGLVTNPDEEVHARLWQLAAGLQSVRGARRLWHPMPRESREESIHH